ncbi:hypothetical protein SAMN05421870_102186 [Streptomyces qinglanensis]|uniref:Uncharacterized protein n=1 Tax=Streptomyces qinglanensis TaxID=943816 RepID=A0A1H9PQQ1_9ACTN|nr:hypothetical protein SAMN05421870_102186 [Streptomyces qinglanensis]
MGRAADRAVRETGREPDRAGREPGRESDRADRAGRETGRAADLTADREVDRAANRAADRAEGRLRVTVRGPGSGGRPFSAGPSWAVGPGASRSATCCSSSPVLLLRSAYVRLGG